MNRLKYILAVLVLVTTVSCNKWLDIKPAGQADATDILVDEKGYNYAMGGIYYRLSSENLYGKNTSFGAIDAMAKYWDFSTLTNHSYKAIGNYDYSESNAKEIINNIFKEMYLAVAQSNQILSSLTKNGNEIDNSDLFKGEALALRAYMHFELLKMFGPVIQSKADLSKKAISYRREFDVIATEFNTAEEILNLATEDLKAALELLKNDPIKVNGREGDANDNQLAYSHILKRRGTRLNYYAVLGILARIEMWRDNKPEAYKYAKQLIDECNANKIKDNPVIALTPKEVMGNASALSRDIICEREFIFALYRENLYNVVSPIFSFKDFTSLESSETLIITLNEFTTISNFTYGRQPDGGGTDLRLKYWFTKHEQINDRYQFSKLKKPLESNTIPPVAYVPETPLMKMSEIYYIASECQIGVDNILALKYLNDVRESRGLPSLDGIYTTENLNEYLMREMRKDFFGEGVMFGVYKRKFAPIDVSSTITIAPMESNFIFPIPDDEYEFSPNEKPSK